MAEEQLTTSKAPMPQVGAEAHQSDAFAARPALAWVLPLIVLVVVALAYLSLFCHSESIPTAVGANLVPAERLLKGEVPYRDFYKIQTPGILLINAAAFRMFGTTLLTAMAAVLVFKVLTITMVFVCAMRVSSWRLALATTPVALVWVAPGGPFRSAPVQFEMFFLLSAAWLTVSWMSNRKAANIFLAGLAVGLVAVFKQNVGVYAAVALAGSIVLNERTLPRSWREATAFVRESLKTERQALMTASLGVAIPIAAMAIYLTSQRALGAAIEVFLKGPGEHLQSRFTGYPLPKYAAPIILTIVIALAVGRWLVAMYARQRILVTVLLLAGAVISAMLSPRPAADNFIYWFAPALFGYAAWRYWRDGRMNPEDVPKIGSVRALEVTLLLFAVAAFGEVFPRSVRGLVIDTMPPALILLAFLFGPQKNGDNRAITSSSVGRGFPKPALVFSVVSVVLLVFGVRVSGPSFFTVGHGRGLHLKSDTELDFDRGRGVYLPPKRARDVNAIVSIIRSRVEPGGYFFAHALDTTSYYFLADRNSPTSATLWNDTGTNDAERARTADALRRLGVRLVLTSKHALAVERYGPLLDLLRTDFHETTTIGQTIILERNY
jgi:hypothetical protein